MEKRVIIAFLISAVILTAYAYWFNPTQKPEDQKPPATAEQSKPVPPSNVPAPQLPVETPVENKPVRQVRVLNNLWSGEFSSQGASVTGWVLERLSNGKVLRSSSGGELKVLSPGIGVANQSFQLEFPGDSELSKRLNSAVFDLDLAGEVLDAKDRETQLNFSYQDSSGLSVKKTFVFFPNRFDFGVSVEARRGETQIPVRLLIGPGFGDPTSQSGNSYTSTPPQVMAEINGSVERLTSVEGNGIERRSGAVHWAALSDHYFAFILVPAEVQSEVAFIDAKKSGSAGANDQMPFALGLPVGKSVLAYIGPKDRSLLTGLNDQINKTLAQDVDLEDVIDYGIFRIMIKPIVPIISYCLDGLHKLIPNYGWSIIVFTILINLLFFPLKWKSSVAMKRAQKLQPKMKALQDKMKALKKEDPQYQKLQMEQIALMKEGNPLQGCLPLLVQMPIFWAIFIYLSISIYVRQSPWFGWISDLSSPDPYYVLPIVMCISMIAQSALTPTPTDAQQKMQKYMMTWAMPILFTVLFFVQAPSGLVIYWMFSNLVGVGQQVIINRLT